MVAEPVGNRLDEAGAVGVTGGGNGLFSRGAHRHNVIPVDLLTGESFAGEVNLAPGGIVVLRATREEE